MSPEDTTITKGMKASKAGTIALSSLALAAALLVMFFLDVPAMRWIRGLKGDGNAVISFYEAFRPVIKFATHGAPLLVSSVLIFIYGKYRAPKLERAGLAMITGFLVSGLGVQVLKHLAGRARPRVTDAVLFIGPNLKGDYDSFPSGHTTVSFCIALILSRHFPRYSVVFYAFALLAALDRFLGLSHFPSDLITGALVGIISGKAVDKYVKTV